MPMGQLDLWRRLREVLRDRHLQPGCRTYPAGYKPTRTWTAYALSGTYKYTGGEAGLLFKYYDDRTTRRHGAAAPARVDTRANLAVRALRKGTFGPVYIEGEFTTGSARPESMQCDTVASRPDVDASAAAAPTSRVNSISARPMSALGLPTPPATTASDASKSNRTGRRRHRTQPRPDPDGRCAPTWTNGQRNRHRHDRQHGQPASPTGKSNMMIVNAFGGFKPTPKLNFEASFT